MVLAVVLVSAYATVRYRGNITCRREIGVARAFLLETVQTEQPSGAWIQQCDASNPTNAFFFFKIWFEEAGVPASQLARAYTDLPTWSDGTVTAFNLHYGRHLPDIQCFVTPSNGIDRVRAFFPLNNCLFHPDFNRDERIDQRDVIASRTEREKFQHIGAP